MSQGVEIETNEKIEKLKIRTKKSLGVSHPAVRSATAVALDYGFSWVLLSICLASRSMSAVLQQSSGDVPTPLFEALPVSVRSVSVARSGMTQHHRPRLHVVRADRRHHHHHHHQKHLVEKNQL